MNEKYSLKKYFPREQYENDADEEARSVLQRWEVKTCQSYQDLPPDLDQTFNILPMDWSMASARNKIVPEEFLDYARTNPVIVLLSLGVSFSALCSAVAGNWTGYGLATLALLPLGWMVVALCNRAMEYTREELHTLDHARVALRLQGFLVFVSLLKLGAFWALVEYQSITTADEFLVMSVGANVVFAITAAIIYSGHKPYKTKEGESVFAYARTKMRFAWHADVLRYTTIACVLVSPVLAKCVLALGLSLVPKFVSHEYTIKRQLRLTKR